jgi:hypothetical protein
LGVFLGVVDGFADGPADGLGVGLASSGWRSVGSTPMSSSGQ